MSVWTAVYLISCNNIRRAERCSVVVCSVLGLYLLCCPLGGFPDHVETRLRVKGTTFFLLFYLERCEGSNHLILFNTYELLVSRAFI